MDENKDTPSNSEPNPVMDDTSPKYLEERPRLDRKIQQGIRAHTLHNRSFTKQFFRLLLPLIVFVIGGKLLRYHNRGGEIPVSLLVVIPMIALGTFFTILYAYKLLRESIPDFKRIFLNYEGEELGHIHDRPPSSEDIENEIEYLLSLPGAPTFENYKDSTKHERKLFEYSILTKSHSNLQRHYLIPALNISLLFIIPDLFMGIFFGETVDVISIALILVLFIYASFMYFKTYQRCLEYFNERVPVASYTLIEYSMFRILWEKKSKNII